MPTRPPPDIDSPSEGALLRASSLSVRFGSVRAIDGVDFELRAGEVHAVLGQNGAGKSTLIKCLSGAIRPTAGDIQLRGKSIQPASPHEAESLGIATVYQEVGLIPHLSVAENICLGREPVRRFWPRLIDWGRVRIRARDALARLGLGVLDVRQELSACSIAVQQLVAIARALDVKARVLILDEPTSSLDRDECARLLGVIRQLRKGGIGIVFISHFLDQVDAVSDRVTILRDGQLVGTFENRSLPRAKLISLMVGREFDATAPARPEGTEERTSEPLLSAAGLGRAGVLEHVDLSVAPGEAVGLAGLLGSGRTETARLLFGADTATRGQVKLRGRAVRFGSPQEAIASGLAYTPENRKAEGVFSSLSLLENVVLSLQARRGLWSRLGSAELEQLVAGFVSTLGIKADGVHAAMAGLSGGNQQKALVARWLALRPDLLILDEPTRGIDIAAKADVLAAIGRMRAGGMAVLFIGSEIEETVRVCSRIVVLRDRRSVAELGGGEVGLDAVLAAVAAHHE